MASDDCIDSLVIGAGVVGLAVGRALALAGHETVVAERHGRIGEEISSRNSGVIHSGIYYAPGTLKARLCVRGRSQLYAYCCDRNVAHWQCGKLLVASERQVPRLYELHSRGLQNQVTDLEMLSAEQARQLEPEVRCSAALLSPSTGILDVHGLMIALLGDLEDCGGVLALDTWITGVQPEDGGLRVEFVSGGESSSLVARQVVNAAGLSSVDLLHRVEGYPQDRAPDMRLAKGSYFSYPGRPFRHLVYPMPSEAGLGIHATLDLDGRVRFGPDVEWVDHINYAVDPRRVDGFYRAIREYWPAVVEHRLQADYSGIRPKITGPGQQAADFLIEGPGDHGIPGLVNLLGIESPGLTAALAIGEHVVGVLGDAMAPSKDPGRDQQFNA